MKNWVVSIVGKRLYGGRAEKLKWLIIFCYSFLPNAGELSGASVNVRTSHFNSECIFLTDIVEHHQVVDKTNQWNCPLSKEKVSSSR